MPTSRRVLHLTTLALLLGSVLLLLSKDHRNILQSAAGRLHDGVLYYYWPQPSVYEPVKQSGSGSIQIPNPGTQQWKPEPDAHRMPGMTKKPNKAITITTTTTSSLSTATTHNLDKTKATDIHVNSDALSKLCSTTQWTDGLWLMCHSSCGPHKKSLCGGLTNARNRIQTCLRMAIDAGAGAIITSVTARAEDDLLNTGDREICPDAWWNIDSLESDLQRQCPQMKLQFCDANITQATVLKPEFRHYLGPVHKKGTFKTLLQDTVNRSTVKWEEISPKEQVVVEYGDTYIGWDYSASTEMSSIRKQLFKPLKYNSTLLSLGQQILKSPQLKNGAFIGVHLRGEGDWPSGFGSAHDQMNRYVSEIQSISAQSDEKILTVYVMCGDRDAVQRFRDQLVPLNYTVHDKWSLLSDKPKQLAKIESVGFDSKGVVEYEVMMKARYWMGISSSSMSALIAYARTVDEKKDFFETYIYPGSVLNGLNRGYTEAMVVKGNKFTKLLVVNGVDIMSFFP